MAGTAGRSEEESPGLDALLEHIKQSRGFDFSGYKRPSLERRIRRRLAELGIESYTDYQDYLEVNPDEFTDLFDTILINVTSFFRDAEAWEHLGSEVVPKLIQSLPDSAPIRVWSAGCASGEEAYTAAMVLAEALGEEGFRNRVKIYATDVDEDALATARHAVYSRDALKAVPQPLLERYWEPNSKGLGFRTDLRRAVIFGRNDLVRDAPISRIDLLISRNTLMYFTPETQARILGHFNFSLSPSGYLFLGKSEMLLTHGSLFKPHSLKWRVFTRVERTGIRERLAFVTTPARPEEDPALRYAHLREGAADTMPVAQVVLDSNGFLASANQAARSMFGLGPADVGRPIQDLEISYRPIDLRTGLARMQEERRPVNVGRMRWAPATEVQRSYDVLITPVLADATRLLGASITFTDVTELATLTEQYKDSSHQLETAYEELQSTVEELETTNEELQSTNEELETTNEELQSTNEELETMNEELQSTNDELEAMNEVQQERTQEVDRLNLFLEGILGNLGVGVVVLDQQQVVQIWNDSATELWGLRAEEAQDRPFGELDIGLPPDGLGDALRAALGEEPRASTVTVAAVSRRGKQFDCTVRTLPLVTPAGEHYGVIMLMSGLDGRLPPHAVEITSFDG
jgi:two-component system, chemotaxis family, CheB/CheR fusion protein